MITTVTATQAVASLFPMSERNSLCEITELMREVNSMQPRSENQKLDLYLASWYTQKDNVWYYYINYLYLWHMHKQVPKIFVYILVITPTLIVKIYPQSAKPVVPGQPPAINFVQIDNSSTATSHGLGNRHRRLSAGDSNNAHDRASCSIWYSHSRNGVHGTSRMGTYHVLWSEESDIHLNLFVSCVKLTWVISRRCSLILFIYL